MAGERNTLKVVKWHNHIAACLHKYPASSIQLIQTCSQPALPQLLLMTDIVHYLHTDLYTCIQRWSSQGTIG